MENYTNLLTELHPDGILVVTVNRPAQYNALNISALNELSAVLAEAAREDRVKAVLLTGAGPKSFIAGADISEFLSLSPTESRQFAERGQAVLFQIEHLSKPVVAAINGFALGGGCEVAMACHLRVASEEARLGQPEVKLGIIPGYGGTQRLTKLVGKGKALEMMLTGNPITAAEAYRIGLVNYVQPAELLLEFCLDLIRQMIDKAPIALAKVIEAVNASLALDETAGYAAEASAFEACCQSADFREGTSAFVEKRRPMFTGR
jgi:enoyl-CoA hydratase